MTVRRGALTRVAPLLALAGFALAGLGCPAKSGPDTLVERAAFGVFFGGQIQDRSELPFELDPAKQRIGIRVDFRAPLTRALPVGWEISRPVSVKASKSDAGTAQVVEVGDAAARIGESRLDIPLSMRQGQVLGTWHVRLKVDAHVVIDRNVLVFDARERRERERERDAGH
ncbi:MAG: hypothetical protein ABI488_22865 [Polyangiaceae bacterium]